MLGRVEELLIYLSSSCSVASILLFFNPDDKHPLEIKPEQNAEEKLHYLD